MSRLPICHSKLTEIQVQEIRNTFTGKRGQQLKLSKEYKVSEAAISYVVNNKTWVNSNLESVQ